MAVNMGRKTRILYRLVKKKKCELSIHEKITGILETQLRLIYGEKMQRLEIINSMPYPMKDHLYVVRYNIDLAEELPIRRAQIVVDVNSEELKKFEPGLL